MNARIEKIQQIYHKSTRGCYHPLITKDTDNSYFCLICFKQYKQYKKYYYKIIQLIQHIEITLDDNYFIIWKHEEFEDDLDDRLDNIEFSHYQIPQ